MLDFDSLELSKSKPSWTIPAIKEKLMSKFENAEDLLLEKPEPKKAKTKKIKETLREENITNMKVDDLNDTSDEDNSGKKTSTGVNVRTTDTDTNIDTNKGISIGTDVGTDVGSSIDKAIDDNNAAAGSEPIITLSNVDEGIKDNITQNKLKDIIVEAEKEVKKTDLKEANTTINKFLRLIEQGIPQQTSTNVSGVEKAKILRTVINGILAQNLDVTYIALTKLTKGNQEWKWSKAKSKPTTIIEEGHTYQWHEVPETYLDIDDSKVFDILANNNYKLGGLLKTLKKIPEETLKKIFPELSSCNKTNLPKELAKKFSSVPLDFSRTKGTKKHSVDETDEGSHPIYESLFKMAGLKLVKLDEKNVPASADSTPGEIQFISKASTTSDTGYASNASMCNIYNIYAPKLNEIFLKLKRNKIIYFESNPDIESEDKIVHDETSENIYFESNPDIESEDKIVYAGTSDNIYFDIIYFYKDSDGPAEKYKLRFRFSGTTKDVNNKGTIFENILFRQLYTGLKAKNKEKEPESVQSIIESANNEYKNNNKFKKRADDTSNEFIEIITGMLGLKGIVPDFTKEVRVYLAVNNSSAAAFSELDAALKSNVNIKGKTSLETAETLKQYVDTSNGSFAALLPDSDKSASQILTENIIKKADVVVSVSCSSSETSEYHVLYIPISIKLSENNGNGGDFGQKTWIRLAKDNNIAIRGTNLEQQIIGLFRYLEATSEEDSKFQNFLKAITYYYVGDLSCIYAYCKNVTPVLANTAEAKFKFKRPKFINSISKFKTIKNDDKGRIADNTNCTYIANTETGSVEVKFSKSGGQGSTTLKLQAGIFASLLTETDKAGANKLFRQFHPEASF
jgi:hypothetical protein